MIARLGSWLRRAGGRRSDPVHVLYAGLAQHRSVPYMCRMSRLNLVLTEPQKRWLEREAKRLGLSIGELLRRIIDQVREAK